MTLSNFGKLCILAACCILSIASVKAQKRPDQKRPDIKGDTVVIHNRLPAGRQKLANQIGDIAKQHIHMPPLPFTYSDDRYINTTADKLQQLLKGKIVLIDIWDYTCVNCIRTLPYLEGWYERYKDKGLVIIGVHSPEFTFEKDQGNLDSAVKRFGITYPVIADNDLEIWQSLANKSWPAKYLFDSSGVLRAEHFGEGDYQAFEAFIQKMLLERDTNLDLPEPIAPIRETDKPGAVCRRTTPETYVGYAQAHVGNPTGEDEDESHTYHAPEKLAPDVLYLDGRWEAHAEYVNPAGGVANLLLNYEAKEVNLVIHPLQGAGFKVWVEQDGKPVPPADRGTDVQETAGRTFIYVDTPRMYNIINNAKFDRRTLKVSSDSPSFGAYAFTFGSVCDTQ